MSDTDINAVVAMVCVAAVSILVGFVLMGQMETTAMPSMTNSVLSTSGNTVLTGFGNAGGMLALGMFVVAAVFITTIIGSVLGKGE